MLEGDAFDGAQYAPPARHFPVCGTLRNFNTIEDFRNVDKKELFAQAVTRVWNDVASGAALRDPSLLNRFLVLAFADLKVARRSSAARVDVAPHYASLGAPRFAEVQILLLVCVPGPDV